VQFQAQSLFRANGKFKPRMPEIKDACHEVFELKIG
jgi:hypothetical protein